MTVFVSENPLWVSRCTTVSFDRIVLVLANISEETAESPAINLWADI